MEIILLANIVRCHQKRAYKSRTEKIAIMIKEGKSNCEIVLNALGFALLLEECRNFEDYGMMPDFDGYIIAFLTNIPGRAQDLLISTYNHFLILLLYLCLRLIPIGSFTL